MQDSKSMAVRAMEGDGDTISRKMAIDEVKRLHDVAWANWKETRISANTMIDALKDLPSAQPERNKGEWEEIDVIQEAYDIAGVKTWASKMRCNQCGFTTFAIEGRFAQYDFCPHCGADMRGESDG